ncbi:hypothetical protein A8C75_15095 [Marinobacterium aestuarii]|uniref:Uncharacterized protein n=1 Tax=Marinobacterium aestuarii TaxID=1821621 RepID=A0A1A9F014_9GAMM|nr:hypothetical protein [Marinobacterium aestuarii]ANG63674.1 hypothetical protein A8C75_15095 [Marinobacterium aestuarii]
MPRNLLAAPLLLSLLGCQIPDALQPIASNRGPACYVSNDALAGLLLQQQRYLNQSDQARRQQLAQVIKSNDKALEALLLTSPMASAEQFDQGRSLLTSLPLYPSADCTADRYLDIQKSQLEPRQQQLTLIQQQSARIQQQNAQISELKRKIEALTDLEQEITRQRKDL